MGTAALFPEFVPTLCRESIPAVQLDIPALGPYRRSHVFDATLPVGAPHGRAGTPLATLVTMQLSEGSISGQNLVYQLPSDRRGLLVWDGETLEPFRKVASHHEAVLVPCQGDRVGTGDVHRQAFHRNPDDVLRSRIRCRSWSHQLAVPVLPAPGCVLCPDEL